MDSFVGGAVPRPPKDESSSSSSRMSHLRFQILIPQSSSTPPSCASPSSDQTTNQRGNPHIDNHHILSCTNHNHNNSNSLRLPSHWNLNNSNSSGHNHNNSNNNTSGHHQKLPSLTTTTTSSNSNSARGGSGGASTGVNDVFLNQPSFRSSPFSASPQQQKVNIIRVPKPPMAPPSAAVPSGHITGDASSPNASTLMMSTATTSPSSCAPSWARRGGGQLYSMSGPSSSQVFPLTGSRRTSSHMHATTGATTPSATAYCADSQIARLLTWVQRCCGKLGDVIGGIVEAPAEAVRLETLAQVGRRHSFAPIVIPTPRHSVSLEPLTPRASASASLRASRSNSVISRSRSRSSSVGSEVGIEVGMRDEEPCGSLHLTSIMLSGQPQPHSESQFSSTQFASNSYNVPSLLASNTFSSQDISTQALVLMKE
ncbi:Hypothetical protein, putative, partial [Bodo saltans]